MGSKSNSITLPDISNLILDKNPSNTSPSQTNSSTLQNILSSSHNNKEPVNVTVQKTVENQSEKASPKIRKTSPEQSASSLGDKKQSEDLMQLETDNQASIPPKITKKSSSNNTLNPQIPETSSTPKQINDPLQNIHHQKVSKTSPGQSQTSLDNHDSKDSSTNIGLQSLDKKDSLTLSQNSLMPEKGKVTSNDSTHSATKNTSQSSSMKNSSPSKSNSITLPDISNLNLDKNPSNTSPSQTNSSTSQNILSSSHNNKEPVNVTVQKTVENQSEKASQKIRKTSLEQSASSLGDKKQSEDSIKLETDKQAKIPPKPTKELSSNNTLNPQKPETDSTPKQIQDPL